jgi:hypothetical protein
MVLSKNLCFFFSYLFLWKECRQAPLHSIFDLNLGKWTLTCCGHTFPNTGNLLKRPFFTSKPLFKLMLKHEANNRKRSLCFSILES